MKDRSASAGVVVGVDGSQAASNAVDGRSTRQSAVMSRYAYFISPASRNRRPRTSASRSEYAETSLRAATAAVKAAGKPVKIETDILWGAVSAVLIDESRTAALVCVGSVGIGAVARELLGSTAAALAENAHCPVSIGRFLAGHTDESVQLAVIGEGDVDQIAYIVGPHNHPIVHR